MVSDQETRDIIELYNIILKPEAGVGLAGQDIKTLLDVL
jgi:hypothetical protein